SGYLLSSSAQAYLLWTVRGVVRNRNCARTNADLGWCGLNLDQAVCTCGKRRLARPRHDLLREVSGNGDATDVQRRRSNVGDCYGFGSTGHTNEELGPVQRG